MSTVLSGTNADLDQAVRQIATEEGLSGVVRVDLGGEVVSEAAFGWSHRGLGVEMTIDSQLAIASGCKGFTALVVMGLVEQGKLELDTPVRSILGGDLELIDDRVTVEHLLAHRSGIGDYLDEDVEHDDDPYLMGAVHELVETSDYLPILGGHPSKFTPDERFSYCNGGYVVLALIIERVSGRSFHDVVAERVCGPAGMVDTAFLRSDALPGRAALGYLHDDGLSTNVFHLPVRGNGDGGIYTTAADIHAFWDALMAGRIVAPDTLADMMRARSDFDEELSYGLGFWLPRSGGVSIHGFDTGVGFVSVHDPARRWSFTVMSNKSRGAWPCSQRISRLLAA